MQKRGDMAVIEPTAQEEFLIILKNLISKIESKEIEIESIFDTGYESLTKEALYEISFRYTKGETNG